MTTVEYEGYAARRYGIPLLKNPYKKGTTFNYEWDAGWIMRDNEILGNFISEKYKPI